MVRHCVLSMALCICVVSSLGAEENSPKTLNKDLKSLQGLWEGTWGGGAQDDATVFQPILLRLAITGNRAEWRGLPLDDGRGTVSLSKSGKDKTLRLTYTVKVDGQPRKKTADVSYAIKEDELTLSPGKNGGYRLLRVTVQQQPLANAIVEFVAANGISDSGDLLVTRYSVLQVAPRGSVHFKPHKTAIPTKDASIFHVHEREMKKITIDQARAILNKVTPVVVTYRQDERPLALEPDDLWQDVGSAQPDSEVVTKTFSNVLRPGTLVFVIPSKVGGFVSPP